MRTKSLSLLFALIFSESIFAGCGSLLPNPTIFDTPPCKAPCWQNVTPRISETQDALTIFRNHADRNGILFDTYPPVGFDSNVIHFSLTDGDLVFVRTLNGRVSAMQFEGNFAGPLTLQHAIEIFGDPKSVLVEEFGEWDRVSLLNPIQGIAFGWQISGSSPSVNSGQAEINPNTVVGLV